MFLVLPRLPRTSRSPQTQNSDQNANSVRHFVQRETTHITNDLPTRSAVSCHLGSSTAYRFGVALFMFLNFWTERFFRETHSVNQSTQMRFVWSRQCAVTPDE